MLVQQVVQKLHLSNLQTILLSVSAGGRVSLGKEVTPRGALDIFGQRREGCEGVVKDGRSHREPKGIEPNCRPMSLLIFICSYPLDNRNHKKFTLSNKFLSAKRSPPIEFFYPTLPGQKGYSPLARPCRRPSGKGPYRWGTRGSCSRSTGPQPTQEGHRDTQGGYAGYRGHVEQLQSGDPFVFLAPGEGASHPLIADRKMFPWGGLGAG